MNPSKSLKQKLFKNRIKYNNMMLNIKSRKNTQNDINNVKTNLFNINQPLIENNIPMNNINSMNIVMNKTKKNNINNLNNIISQIKPPDARLIYCIKKLGLSRYYSNFSQKNMTFEEFLTLTNEDMTKMKIPKNYQKIVQKFISEYFNYRELFTIEELKNFFRSKKSKDNLNEQKMSHSFDIYQKGSNVKNNNYMKQKNILNNNYILENNNNISRNNTKLNQKKCNNSATQFKRNYLYQKQKLNSANINILKVKERYQNINNYINNMHQSNQNKNFLAHNKNGFDNINNSEIDYNNNQDLKNNKRKNNNYMYQSANSFQNSIKNKNIINLKNSYQNYYKNNFEQNDININNYLTYSNFNNYNENEKYENENIIVKII